MKTKNKFKLKDWMHIKNYKMILDSKQKKNKLKKNQKTRK